tara:strand:- start:105 stop:497 length:393 start_codon:yes stop_codon:yes gene_type:complete
MYINRIETISRNGIIPFINKVGEKLNRHYTSCFADNPDQFDDTEWFMDHLTDAISHYIDFVLDESVDDESKHDVSDRKWKRDHLTAIQDAFDEAFKEHKEESEILNQIVTQARKERDENWIKKQAEKEGN